MNFCLDCVDYVRYTVLPFALEFLVSVVVFEDGSCKII